MTANETIKWVVLPNGVTTIGGTPYFQFAIYAAPELSGGSTGTLADFTDFLTWPQTLTTDHLAFEVTFVDANNNPTSYVVQFDPTPLNGTLWTNLFAASTRYVPRTVDSLPNLQRPIVSYPASHVSDFLTSQYQTLPTTTQPTHAEAMSVYGAISPTLVGTTNAEIRARQASERLAPGANGEVPYANDFSGATLAESFAAHGFYFQPGPSPPPPGVNPSPLDFHSALSFVGEHRSLQRALGLGFDLTIEVSALTNITLSSQPNQGVFVSAQLVQPAVGKGRLPYEPFTAGGGATYTAISARTHAIMSTSVFEPYSDTSDPGAWPILGGHLVVGDETKFDTHIVDLDAGGLKATSFTSSLILATAPSSIESISPAAGHTSRNGSSAANGSSDENLTLQIPPLCFTLDPAETFPPPAVRNNGLTLTLTNRGALLASQLVRSGLLFQHYATPSPNPNPDLVASDLVRGLILDVYDTTTSRWYSTNACTVTYTSPASKPTVTITATDDEGGTAAPGTSAPPTVQNTPGEASAQQFNVSETILTYKGWSNAAPRFGTPLQDADNALTGPGPFGTEINIQLTPVPGSLPRLRFGRTYYLRARVVDIAGNVIPIGQGAPIDNGENLAVGPIAYNRLEPIKPPDVYAQNATGNAIKYPVPGEGVRRMVIRDVDVASTSGAVTSNRLLAPPRVTQPFAEQMGMFDTAAGGALDVNAYGVFITRESAQYVSTNNNAPPPMPPAAISPTQPVPYLPDPLARGGMITIQDNGPMPAGTIQFDFSPPSGQAWPEYQPYVLTLAPNTNSRGGAESASIDQTTRTITFAIDPADLVTLTLACTFDAEDAVTYGIGLLIPGFEAQNGSLAKYWALTAWETMELIYTVQKPLLTPEFPSITAARTKGDTFATLKGFVTYSPKSTSTIDLQASWGDPVDNPNVFVPFLAGDENAATQRALPAAASPGNAAKPGPGGSPVTTPIEINPIPGLLQGPGAPNPALQQAAGVHVFTGPPNFGTSGSDCVVPAQPSVQGFGNAGSEMASTKDGFSGGRHEFHDTKHRNVTYSAIATTRFAEFYPEIADRTQLTATTQSPVLVNVLSSARPASLSIPYVVPIYEWEPVSDVVGAVITTGRSPSGLRVFIERPWWSSGIDELLGVVIWPMAEYTTTPPAPVAPLQTILSSKARTEKERADKLKIAADRAARKKAGENAAGPTSPIETKQPITGVLVPEYPPPTVPIGAPDDLYVSDWGLDPLFAGGALPTPHPNLQAFPNAVATHTGLSIEENATITVDVAGHNVEFDESRNLWFADVAVDTGKAYTPMIRLALARYQPNSISGVELGRITLVDIMPLEPGRSLTVSRRSDDGHDVVDVTLSGYSYSKAANTTKVHNVKLAPGVAQVLIERQDSSISDPDLGWEGVTAPVTMKASTAKDGTTTWTATGLELPSGGNLRVYVNQYEVLPTDKRDGGKGQLPGYRLLYQDMVPIPKPAKTFKPTGPTIK